MSVPFVAAMSSGMGLHHSEKKCSRYVFVPAPPSRMGQPVLAGLLGYAVLGQSLSVIQLLDIVPVLFGLFLVTAPRANARAGGVS